MDHTRPQGFRGGNVAAFIVGIGFVLRVLKKGPIRVTTRGIMGGGGFNVGFGCPSYYTKNIRNPQTSITGNDLKPLY